MNKEKIIYTDFKRKKITSSEEWLEWYSKRCENYEDWEKTSLLLQVNKFNFKNIFGKQDFCFTDSESRRIWAWKITLKSGYLWLLTDSNEKGTGYEATEDIHWAEIKGFFIDLIKKIEQNQNIS